MSALSETAQQQGAAGTSPAAKAPALTLQAQAQMKSPTQLELRIRVENRSSNDVLVFDRLWLLNQANKIESDPQKAYRFYRDQTLRIWFGPAPLPRLKTVTLKNIPYGTVIKAEETHELSLILQIPVAEYSPYFPETDPDKRTELDATRLEIVVQYIRLDTSVKTRPATAVPGATELAGAAFLDRIETATSILQTQPLKVLRRTDEFDRAVLPGEAPEPLKLGP